MTIVCSWCRGEGLTGIIGEKTPLEDRRETHGICMSHRMSVQSGWGQPAMHSTAETHFSGGVSSSAGHFAELWISLKNFTRKNPR
jgi:hypothetical protein